MLLSESYKTRLQLLAGIITEDVSMGPEDIASGWDKSSERVSGYDEAMMLDAIENGRAIGISYKSDNDKYTMPVTKFRFIMPVALGRIKGKLFLSGYHLHGQSEKNAISTNKRSAEAKGEWRLFEITSSKFKGMWLTDTYFLEYPPGYRKNDSRMNPLIAQFDLSKALELKKQRDAAEQPEFKAPKIAGVEKPAGIDPSLEYPIQEKSYPDKSKHKRGRRRRK